LNRSIDLLGRVLLSTDPAGFSYLERSYVADLRDTPRVVPAAFNHQLDASQIQIVLEPMITVALSRHFSLMVGPRIGVPVSSTFAQTETLFEPRDYGEYLNGGRTWINQSGAIPNASSLTAAITAAVRWRVPLNSSRSIHLLPELSYSHALTNVASGVAWRPHAIRFGLGLGWSSGPQEPSIGGIDSTVVSMPLSHGSGPFLTTPTSPPSIRLRVTGVAEDGTEISDPVIQRREVYIRTLHPLLGHVYFDEGDSRIPERYVRGITRAREDTLTLTPIEALHGELAIIAARMAKFQSAKLTIGAITSNTKLDRGAELARARAEEVRSALEELGVEPNRMSVVLDQAFYPLTKASDTSQRRLALEENQRVEIHSTQPEILDPITLGTREISVSPRRIRIVDSATASGLRVVLRQLAVGDRTVSLEHDDQQRDFREDVTIQPMIEHAHEDHIAVLVNARDSAGDEISETRRIPIAQSSDSRWRNERSGDIIIERYGLVLFDFNDAKLSDHHRRIIDIIRSRITPETMVSVIGTTDLMGGDAYNRELSLRRARQIARALGISRVSVDGLGETSPVFPNVLPEGRASNRTVIVELRTKMP
jgi:outer membrane protein OmpA-like peptidoglycan-associated protein